MHNQRTDDEQTTAICCQLTDTTDSNLRTAATAALETWMRTHPLYLLLFFQTLLTRSRIINTRNRTKSGERWNDCKLFLAKYRISLSLSSTAAAKLQTEISFRLRPPPQTNSYCRHTHTRGDRQQFKVFVLAFWIRKKKIPLKVFTVTDPLSQTPPPIAQLLDSISIFCYQFFFYLTKVNKK